MSNLNLKSNPTLADMQKYAHDMMLERGFNTDPAHIAKSFMLLTEEVGELAKAARKTAGMSLDKNANAQDVPGEAADVFIVLLCICNMLGVDLEQAFRDKEEQNKHRRWVK